MAFPAPQSQSYVARFPRCFRNLGIDCGALFLPWVQAMMCLCQTAAGRVTGTAVLNDLERLWPLIQEYPWQFITVAAMGFALGWGGHGVWRQLQPKAASKKPTAGTPGKLMRTIRRILFRPSSIQIDCLRALRLVDHKRLEVGEVHRLLAHPDMDAKAWPRSDVEQALEGLVAVGWVTRSLAGGPRLVYSLDKAGLDYARRQGYLVIDWEGE